MMCAVAGAAALALPGIGKYLAIGLAILAVLAGAATYRKRDERAGSRLAGAAGVAVGGATLLFGTAKVALTLMAIERLALVFH